MTTQVASSVDGGIPVAPSASGVAPAPPDCEDDPVGRHARLWCSLIVVLLVGLLPAHAVAYGGDGVFVLARGFDQASDVAMLPDGSVLVADVRDSAEARTLQLWPDGRRVRVPGFDATGLAVAPDGSVLAVDGTADANVVRRWVPGSAPMVVASRGGGPLRGFGGDGGPALAAQIDLGIGPPGTPGVVASPDGGFLFADTANLRVRGVDRTGVIATVAGSGRLPSGGRRGDGGQALDASFAEPFGLARTPQGGYIVTEMGANRVRRIGPDGIVETLAARVSSPGDVVALDDGAVAGVGRVGLWRIPPGARRATPDLRSRPTDLWDFAGRSVGAVGVGRDTGIGLLIAAEDELVYIPNGAATPWPLVALRSVTTRRHGLMAVIEATQPGIATLDVLRSGHVIARRRLRVDSGHIRLRVHRRLPQRWLTVRIRLQHGTDATAHDAVNIHAARRLTIALARHLLRPLAGPAEDSEAIIVGARCQRFGRRRVDCELRLTSTSTRDSCMTMASVNLRASGIALAREYPCRHRRRGVFRARPKWDDIVALGPVRRGA
jgi:hypothetical protein